MATTYQNPVYDSVQSDEQRGGQRQLNDQQSRLVNAKLILLLANHIGDPQVLREAMATARQGV